jgi:hypothetical protein
MITVILQGGAGNQLFQFAFGLAQANRLGVDVQFDLTRLVNRSFALGQWNIDGLRLAPRHQPTIREVGLPYNQALVDSIKDGDVLQGYWQSEKYFAGVDLRGLVPFYRNSGLENKIIGARNSVAVHVRRGDYLVEPHKSFHGVLDRNTYYKPAMDYIRHYVYDPTFFIFSDDPIWVRDNWYCDFSLGREEIVYPSNEAADIFAMSLCDHVITANSSFSWWGAWLGDPRENTYVISPKNWFGPAARENAKDIVPERWIRI